MKLRALSFFSLLTTVLLGLLFLFFLAIKMAFSQGFVFGFLFVFFVLPVLGRLLFLLFFGILSSFLSLFFSKTLKMDQDKSGSGDDILDVKYKIIK